MNKVYLALFLILSLKTYAAQEYIPSQEELAEAQRYEQYINLKKIIPQINTVPDAQKAWTILLESNFFNNTLILKELSDLLFERLYVLSLDKSNSIEGINSLRDAIVKAQEDYGILKKIEIIDLTKEIESRIRSKNPQRINDRLDYFRLILGNKFSPKIEAKLNQLNNQSLNLLIESGLDSDDLFGLLLDSDTNNESIQIIFG